MGVIRHVDAGYDIAVARRREHGLRIPMREDERHVTTHTARPDRELVTNVSSRRRRRAPATSGAGIRTRLSSSRTSGSPGSGRRGGARGGRAPRLCRRRGDPGSSTSHAHLVFAGDRRPEFAARMAGRPYPAVGSARPSRPPGPPPTSSCAPASVGWSGSSPAPGDDVRGQVRVRADCGRRGAGVPDRRRVHRRGHVPRRARGARGVRRRPRRLPRPDHRADARRLRAARPVDRRVLRARRLRRRRGACRARSRCCRGFGPAGARQPTGSRPGGRARSRVRRRLGGSLHVPDGHRRAMPWPPPARWPRCCRGPSSAPARPIPMRAGCWTPASVVALATDCNPGTSFTTSMPLLHRPGRARDGVDGRGGPVGGDPRWLACAAPRRRRADPRRRPGRPGPAGGPQLRAPCLPARC